ncbi:tetratricopeptide repeat protein [Rubrivirga sp. IMCC45206]|uniref:tetratricopeptide repeat protein n=1 Tax=Rubrivirga sp. IMCC45206 TaxID=3391614 RepID=UPI00398FF8D6
MRSDTARSALGLALAAGIVTLAACLAPRASSDADERFLNLADGVAYVGDATCATCHEELYASYQAHGMANSLYRLTPETAVEDFSGVAVRHPASGFVYVARREGDRFVQEEYRETGEGTDHRLVREMTYVVGSGSAARTYLSEENGRLYELPLTWYTQADDGAGRWGLSPGYEDQNVRFDRTIPDRCMACHNGTSEPVPFADGKFASLADGIGCEQCHGPGELHVEARTASEQAPDSVDVTIVNPKWLATDLRLDVCQQCHLNGEVSVLREGESAYSYRPGRPLSAHRAVFALVGDDPNRVSVISHADRLRESACFIASPAMDCTTCHNPHEGFRDRGPEVFNATCQTCHAPDALAAEMPTPDLQTQHLPEADCFACHMPEVSADDVPHASFTDHKIRVVGDDQIVGTQTEGTLAPYFEADRDGGVEEGMAYVIYARQGGGAASFRRGVSLLEERLAERPQAGEAQYLLGYARLQTGRAAAAIEPLRKALEVGENPERLNALAQAYEQAGRPPSEALRLYQRALVLQPAAADVRVNYGRLLEAQGRLPEAVGEYRKAIAEEPWLAQAHVLLGGALAKGGDLAGATAALRAAIELEPGQADALTNLAVLLAQQGDVARAARLFRRAVEADPQNANAQANLALYYLNEGRAEDALRHAQLALGLDSGQGTALQVLEILRQSAG